MIFEAATRHPTKICVKLRALVLETPTPWSYVTVALDKEGVFEELPIAAALV